MSEAVKQDGVDEAIGVGGEGDTEFGLGALFEDLRDGETQKCLLRHWVGRGGGAERVEGGLWGSGGVGIWILLIVVLVVMPVQVGNHTFDGLGVVIQRDLAGVAHLLLSVSW